MFSLFRRFMSTSTTAMDKAQQLIADHPVVVFSKTWCSYSTKAKQILASFDADFTVYELDKQRMFVLPCIRFLKHRNRT